MDGAPTAAALTVAMRSAAASRVERVAALSTQGPAARVGFGGSPVSSPVGMPRDIYDDDHATRRSRRRSAAAATPRSADRFVPTRSAMDFDLSHHRLTNENLATDVRTHSIPPQLDFSGMFLRDYLCSQSLLEDDYSSGVEYKTILSKMLFEGADKKILRFVAPDPPQRASSSPHSQRSLASVASCGQAELRQSYRENMAHSPFSRMQHRQISHTPEKILDAPDRTRNPKPQLFHDLQYQ